MEFLEAVDPDSLSDLRSLNHLELQELIAISPLFDTGNQLQFQLLVGLIRSLCKQAGTSAVDELLQYGQEQLTHTQIQCMVDRRQRRVTSTLEPTLEELKNGCYGQCERVMDTVSYGPWDYKEKSVKIVTSKLAMLDKLMSACRNNYAVRVKLTDGSEDMGIISLPIEIGDNMFILETPRGKYKIHLDFVDELRIYVK
jgi:ribosome maturation protein Sdo1